MFQATLVPIFALDGRAHPSRAVAQACPRRGGAVLTAYGNVGSSIYYALGVVAIFSLGLTPVSFLIAGVIFVLTAATYTEATVMYPEAGGSSSFARHAFNELVSFVAAWGQMLNYIITVAISAFFVPHYLAVLLGAAGRRPGRHHRRRRPDRRARRAQHQGHQESARLNMVLAVADLFTQILLVGVGVVLVLDPDILDLPGRARSGADLGRLRPRDRGRDGRLYGDRDDLEHGRGGARAREDDPARRGATS